MNERTFTVTLSTDYPNSIDAQIVHLALIKYFVAYVRIDVKETQPPPAVDGEKP